MRCITVAHNNDTNSKLYKVIINMLLNITHIRFDKTDLKQGWVMRFNRSTLIKDGIKYFSNVSGYQSNNVGGENVANTARSSSKI